MSAEERIRVEEALLRIDDLFAGLSHIADPAARERSRELVEAVLDLHGLALARIMAIAASEGAALVDRLADEEQVTAVLLLYGLHPDDAATRVRRALEGLRSRLDAAQVKVTVGRVTGDLGIAARDRQRLRWRNTAARDREGASRCRAGP